MAARDVRLLADLALALLGATSDDEVYPRLAEGLRRVLGDEVILSVSALDPSVGRLRPKVLLGLGPAVEKVAALCGRAPEDLAGDFPEEVRRAMTSGRLVRLEGGIAELASGLLPRPVSQAVAALLGVEEVGVVGFSRGGATGGVCLITRRPGLMTRQVVIEGMSRLAAGALERLRAEAALRQRDEQIQALADNLPDGLVYQIDAGPDGAQRSFTYLSAGVERLHGLTAGEARTDAQRIYGQVLPEDRPRLAELEARALEEVQPLRAEVRLRLPSGEVRWRLFTSAPHRLSSGRIVWNGVELDITERKRSELALAQSEARNRAIVAALPDLLFQISDEGRFLDCQANNPGDLLVPPEQAIGRSVGEVLPPYLAELTSAHIRKARASGALQRFEYCLEVQAEVRHFEARMTVSGPGRVLVLVRDISERKRAEEERERLQTQLSQAHKLESIGRLAGGIAHDFNNMLLVIRANAELALERLRPGDALHDCLGEILRAAKHSAELTAQLLAFARQQAIAPRRLDLNEAVGGSLRMLRRLLGEDIELVWRPGAEAGDVLMDPNQLEQVLTNLCLNARDAVEPGGRIAIETGRREIAPAGRGEAAAAAPGEYALLRVCDNGRGMDQATLARVFEPFFTTKVLGRGTGLGLSTVHGIIEQHGGFIEVESQIGRGTTFHIHLPQRRGDAVAPAERDATTAGARGGERILLVEDEPAILRVCQSMLEGMGYEVVPAADPEEALRKARERAGELHLVLTDVVMPEMDGLELARRLRALVPGLRCLFMSGYSAEVIIHRGLLDHGLLLLQKPFSREELGRKVREALDAPAP